MITIKGVGGYGDRTGRYRCERQRSFCAGDPVSSAAFRLTIKITDAGAAGVGMHASGGDL